MGEVIKLKIFQATWIEYHKGIVAAENENEAREKAELGDFDDPDTFQELEELQIEEI